jgi:hypothetical protein
LRPEDGAFQYRGNKTSSHTRLSFIAIAEKEQVMTIRIAALALAGSLTLGTTGASAAIVCNDDGDCWKVKEKYEYKPEFRLHVYDDDWKWDRAHDHKYRWRESRGRGYWNKGVWIEF